MKVAMIHWAFPPIIGGVESHLAMLGPELVKRGHEVRLLTGSVDGCPEVEDHQGMRVERTPLMDLNTLTEERINSLYDSIYQRISEFIADARPDLIHAHNLHYFSEAHAAALFRAARGIPLLLTAHNVWEGELWDRMCGMAGGWSGVIAVSNYIKREMVRAGYDPDRVWVVYHGIDLNRFYPPENGDGEADEPVRFSELDGKRVIFHPARMCYDKGSHVAVEALRLIVRDFPDVVLVMAGTEKIVDWHRLQKDQVASIYRMIEEYGLKENVFIRFFHWHEMPAMYRRSEFCIYPSCFEEPFGLVMLEAHACGRPIIVSRAGGMPEVIEDGKNGFIVDMHDHVQLADRCRRLLADPELTRRMGLAGRSQVEEKFTSEDMVINTIRVYEHVLNNS